jgi:hypothetical protein
VATGPGDEVAFMGLSRRLRTGALGRSLAGGVAAVAALPLAFVLTRADGLPRTRVPLTGGGAWLASPAQGLLTLIDGSSAQVVGSVRVPVGRPGDEFTAVQAGTSAYLVIGANGTVSRVDGGTYEVAKPVAFARAGSAGTLQVHAGVGATYVVDGERRLASVVDPRTLRVRDTLTLAAQPGPGQSTVDDAGRLWVTDDGGLSWFDGAGKHVSPDVGGRDARLVLVGGRPALVDLARPRVGRLSDRGTVAAWSCLDLRAGERAELLGSTSTGRVLAAVPATGVLVVSGDGADDCGRGVVVGAPGDEFGPLVEQDGYVFVPDRTSGRTAVVDLAARRRVADLSMGIKPGNRLELLAKDGLVFYNDLDGERAGVLRFDGRDWSVGTVLHKYNRGKGGEQILTPTGTAAQTGPAGDRPKPGTNRPGPDRPGPTTRPTPAGPGSQPDPGGSTAPGGPLPTGPGVPSGPGPGGPGAGTSPPPPGGSPPPVPTKPRIRSITVRPAVVVRGKPAVFTADVENAGAGATWSWRILDGATELHSAATAGTMTHTLPPGTAANLTVALDVTTPAGQAASSLPFTTTSNGTPQVTLACTADPGIGQRVTCTGDDEPLSAGAGAWTWTVTGPGEPGTPVPGDAGAPLTRPFDAAGSYEVTLAVAFDGETGTRTVPVAVTDQCRFTDQFDTTPDIRRNAGVRAQEPANVGLTGCFVHTLTPGIQTADWLTVAFSSMEWDSDDGGTGLFRVDVSPAAGRRAPLDGLNADAVTYSLPNGSTKTYDVQANIPPRVVETFACEKQGTDFRYVLKVEDAQVGTPQLTAHLDRPVAMTMTAFAHGGDANFFEAVVPASQVTDTGTWLATVTDGFGEQASGGGSGCQP